MKLNRFGPRHLVVITPVLALILAVAVACGTAEPQQEATAQPPAAQQQQQAPTAVPEAMAEPAATVTRDKLIILTESYGNEVWDPKYESGDKHVWHHVLHARLMGSDDELQYNTSGLATKWEVTDNGLGLEFTIRDGVKFHNGDPLTVEDAIFSNQYINYYWLT